MKITVKLKPDEVFTLQAVLQAALRLDETVSRADAINRILLLRWYKTLKERSVFLSKPLKISVPIETALAFCEIFYNTPFDWRSYNGFLIQKLLHQFDQKTAVPYLLTHL